MQEVKPNIFQIKLAIDVRPVYSVDNHHKFIKRGKNNDYFDKLLNWRSNEPMHGAIVSGKARYIAGLKIDATNESTTTEAFLKRANPKESWHTLIEKLTDDECTCGGYFLHTVTNILGTPIEHYHLSFAKCAISDCGEYVLYSETGKWNQGYYVTIPIWKGAGVGEFVDVYKRYSPSATHVESIYPRPEYESCTLDIDTAVRIKTYYNALVRNNFNPGTIVTIRNGEQDKATKKAIKDKLKGDHAGEDEAGNLVVLFTSKDSQPTEVVNLGTNDLDKQYQEVGKVGQQNILISHGVNPILFKIKTEGQLGGRTELIEAHELFINEYVKVKQIVYKNLLNEKYKSLTGFDEDFEFEQVNPIGYDWLDPNVNKYMSQNEVREKLGLDPSDKNLNESSQTIVDGINGLAPHVAPTVLATLTQNELRSLVGLGPAVVPSIDANSQPVQSTSVNSALKGLSAAENADIIRIVRDFQKKRNGMNEAMALHRITSYGVSEQEARKWLSIPEQVQQSSHDKSVKFFELFSKYAHEINFEDEVLEIHPVKFHSMVDAMQFEGVKLKDYVNTKEIKDAVLNQVKGNPNVSPAEIGKILKIDVPQVDETLKELQKAGLVTEGSGTFTPTEKGINKTTDNTDFEIYTEYVYDLREPGMYAGRKNILPGSGGKLLTTSHEFCKDMILNSTNKAMTFEAIFALENEFGENVWDFRGGFTTQPGGETTDPWCNHIWKAVTKIRKIK